MSAEAVKWLGKGPVWRHKETGKIAGKAVTGSRHAIGTIDTVFCICVAVAYLAFVFGAGREVYRANVGIARYGNLLPVTAGGTVIVAIIAGFAGIVLVAVYLASSQRVRCIAGGLVIFLLMYNHASPVLLFAVIVVSVLGALGSYYHPYTIQQRMEAAGYTMVEAYWKPPPEPASSQQPPMPVDNEQREPKDRHGEPPPGYTGRWGDYEYLDGIARGWHYQEAVSSPSPFGDKPSVFMADRIMPMEPPPDPKYPFGYEFRHGTGYVPRQSDPWESPVPDTVEVHESDVYGDNKPMPDDMLHDMDALHSWPGGKK